MAKDSASDSIRWMESLHRQATTCKPHDGEAIGTLLERYLYSAQAYLNLANGNSASSESQKFAMKLLSNAKLNASCFASVMNNEVEGSKVKESSASNTIPLRAVRAGGIEQLLNHIAESTDFPPAEHVIMAQEHAAVLAAARTRLETQIRDSSLGFHISLMETIGALEESSIQQKDLQVPSAAVNSSSSQPFAPWGEASEALMVLTAYAKRVNNSNRDPWKRQRGAKGRTLYRRDKRAWRPPHRVDSSSDGDDHHGGDDPTKRRRKEQCQYRDLHGITRERDQVHRGVFSVRDSPFPSLEASPVLDDGAPTSTGSINAAARICEILGRYFELERSPFTYERGLGVKGLGASQVLCSWILSFQDLRGQVTSIQLDLFGDDSPP